MHKQPVKTLLEQTLQVSRLLGQDPFLVLHGGGNTSAKAGDTIWAKASGFDLGALTQDGLVQLDRAVLEAMLLRDTMGDLEMMEGYALAAVNKDAPAPTIETLLHHALPFSSVLHTHADAIVALTDTENSKELVANVLGENVVYVPFVMPGFDLASLAPKLWLESGGTALAIVLANHGLFTMGNSVSETYALHLRLVTQAEAYIRQQGINLRAPFANSVRELHSSDSSTARSLLSTLMHYSDYPLTVLQCQDAEVIAFLTSPELERLASQGPTTLEHVIRTKRIPLIGDDVPSYVYDYTSYFEQHRNRATHLTMLNPTPRVILHPTLGLLTTGATLKAATAVMDIYRHTIRVINATELMGGYRTISPSQAFDIEYWELEQRRLQQ